MTTRVKCFRTRSVFAVHFAFFAGGDATPESDKGGSERWRRWKKGGRGRKGEDALNVRTKAIQRVEKPEGSE